MIPHHRGLGVSLVRTGIVSCLFLLIGALVPGNAHTPSARAADLNTLTIGWPQTIETLDPPSENDNPSIWVSVNIYDQLLRTGNDGISLHPDLATSWNITNGGTIYTFHLRPGVHFHDGSVVTSADVKFSLDRAREPKQIWAYLLTAIKQIDAPNPATVKVTLKYPWAPFLSDVAFFATGIYPMAYFKKVGISGMAQHPIGSGPYELSDYKNGVSVTLKKNTTYFDAKDFPMQNIEFLTIPSDTSRELQVEGGQLDVDNYLPYNLIQQVKASSSATAQVSTSTEVHYLSPHDSTLPFSDVKVRQAINLAIDRNAINKAVYYGVAKPAASFMPIGMLDWDPAIPLPTHDLAKAKALLAQSGEPHGFTFNMETRAGNLVDSETSVLLKNELAPLGIIVNIVPKDPTAVQNDQNASTFSFMTTLWTNDIPDPDELVSRAVDYSVAQGFNSVYNNPRLTSLSRQAERTADPAKRKQLYFQIQSIVADQVPFITTVNVPFVNAVSKKVHGFFENPLGYFALQGVTKS
jgi:peptide/nickel transport system substrate-binding protein